MHDIHRLASYAVLCLTILCIFETAQEWARLSRLHPKPESLPSTLQFNLSSWRLPDHLPWTLHEPASRYNYTSLGAYSEQRPLRKRAKIGKCTSIYGTLGTGYYRALDTHVEHNQLHRYPAYILDQAIMDGLWSKETALLQVLLLELLKPKKDRLEWLAWFDADTMILNRRVPLEIFLPPLDMQDVHALVANDWNGLNNGVFYLRVSSWSVNLMANILAYRSYRPEDELRFTEQSAMENLLREGEFKDGAVVVPPRWLNAYPSGGSEEFSYKVRPGDMALHFAGMGDKEKVIGEWVDELEVNRTMWEVPLAKTNLTREAAWFWEGLRLRINAD